MGWSILNPRGLALISIRIPTYIVRAGLKGRKLAADADASSSIKTNSPRSINIIFNRQHRSSTAVLHFLQPLVRELSSATKTLCFGSIASQVVRFASIFSFSFNRALSLATKANGENEQLPRTSYLWEKTPYLVCLHRRSKQWRVETNIGSKLAIKYFIGWYHESIHLTLASGNPRRSGFIEGIFTQ